MEGRSAWHTVRITTWRVMCEDDAISDFETAPYPHDEFDKACEALDEARSDWPMYRFCLVAEVDS